MREQLALDLLNRQVGIIYSHVQVVQIVPVVKSKIRKKESCPSPAPLLLCNAQGTPLDSEMGWTGARALVED